MRKYDNLIYFGGSAVLFLTGFVMLIYSNLWGALVILAGLALIAFGYSMMMRARGDDPEQGLYNGVNGQGKQQSETVKADYPASGEQSCKIWEELEK